MSLSVSLSVSLSAPVLKLSVGSFGVLEVVSYQIAPHCGELPMLLGHVAAMCSNTSWQDDGSEFRTRSCWSHDLTGCHLADAAAPSTESMAFPVQLRNETEAQL